MDPRQRAPFAHASSSADLTSDLLTTSRSYPPPSYNNDSSGAGTPWSGPPSDASGPISAGLWNQERDRERARQPSPNNGSANHHHHHTLTHHHQPFEKSSNGFLQPAGPIYSLDPSPPPHAHHRRHDILSSSDHSRSRPSSPSPNPFRIPTLHVPGYQTVRFVSLCTLWYACSALSNNTGKMILNHFRYPVTLTIVQFFFVAGYCVIFSRPELGWSGRLRQPSKAILLGTLPMAAFQVGGHIFSSLAISRVPVSTVHTIKALSPLFTVAAYALLFRVSYSPATYLSLLPLTLGVMLACSFDISVSNILGLICAFGSTIIFVSQNIFFKKIMPTNADSATGLLGAPKLDKINLLYFSSGMAFLLMIPVWVFNDLPRLLNDWPAPHGGPYVSVYFVLNGTVHFAQNLLAFAILSSTSPVTYSIASLVKRIAVICLAIMWFKQSVHPIQAVGIALTGVGLWMYNNAKRDVEKGERKMRQVEASRDALPLNSQGGQHPLSGSAGGGSSSEGLMARERMTAASGDRKGAANGLFGLFGIARNPPIEPHASPKPIYPPNFQHASHSSALRPNTFYPTSPALSSKPVTPTETAYPSPPASADSSPPNEPVGVSASNSTGGVASRLRDMSGDVKGGEQGFRLPPSVRAS